METAHDCGGTGLKDIQALLYDYDLGAPESGNQELREHYAALPQKRAIKLMGTFIGKRPPAAAGHLTTNGKSFAL